MMLSNHYLLISIALISYSILLKNVILTPIHLLSFYKAIFIMTFCFHIAMNLLQFVLSCNSTPLTLYFFILTLSFILLNLFSYSSMFILKLEGVNFIFVKVKTV